MVKRKIEREVEKIRNGKREIRKEREMWMEKEKK